MIGDDLQEDELEDEIGEDAFQHDFSMPLQENNKDIENCGEYCYETQGSWDDKKKFLTDQLETQVKTIF